MFKKPIAQLEFADVVDFLNLRRREDVRLDYKALIIAPDKIGALASALANTAGGFVVFGVNEQDELPVPPFDGADLGQNASQTIKQACQSLNPPIQPLLSNVLRNPSDSTKCFLVVAVPQSGKAPHATRDGKIYIKVADHKEPVHPSLSQYQRLANERLASSADRERFRADVDRMIQELWNSVGPPLSAQYRSLVDVTVLTAFPDGADVATPQQIIERFHQYRTVVMQSGNPQVYFPAIDPEYLGTFDRGAKTDDYGGGPGGAVCAIHCAGAFSSRAWLPLKLTTRSGETHDIRVAALADVCSLATGALHCAFKWFESVGVYAAMRIVITFHAEADYFLTHPRFVSRPIPHGTEWGPVRNLPTFALESSWSDEVERARLEETIITRFCSAVNVRETAQVRRFIEATRAQKAL